VLTYQEMIVDGDSFALAIDTKEQSKIDTKVPR